MMSYLMFKKIPKKTLLVVFFLAAFHSLNLFDLMLFDSFWEVISAERSFEIYNFS